jgi:hypothetical protein
MKKVLFIICNLLFVVCSYSQERDINAILNQTLSYRGLTRDDISIPIEFFTAAEKSPTNDAKLMLPLVKDMMANPLRSVTWLDSVSEWGNLDVDVIASLCFHYSNINPKIIFLNNYLASWGLGYFMALNKMLVEINNTNKKQYNSFDKDEKEILSKNVLSIFEESDDDDGSNSNIFKFNVKRDSSISISKRVVDVLSKFYNDEIINNSIAQLVFCLNEYENWNNGINKKYLLNIEPEQIDNKSVQGDFYYYSDKNSIRIAIGGPGKNIYTGNFDFIIDLGGDDVYNIENDKNNFGGFRCMIDLSGNDYYTTSSDFALAGGLFSSSFIFDKEGDDFYESKGSGNLGAAIGGLGLLYDEKGNDTYKGISFSIGAGCFGVGLLVDREGNDFYIANSYSQGFGMTQGVGAIVDNKGNDSYLIDSRSLDIGRYNDHYVSMCQGYGLGLRPFYAGGIGLIIEGEGNDIYNTDIFGQGGAYWYSLGAIVDKSGHDKYNGYQYSQGAGIHLAVGLLKDYDGWDFYQSNGVSQGCGHDFGYGMLWDVKGNDNYSAYSLSQGAGNADGIGILIDESGVDGYLNKFPANTRGYGNPRREYGSIGVFLDASGEDYYSQPGYDSTIINSSYWGVFNDYYDKDLPSQVSGDNFKVQVDTVITTSKGSVINANYSIEDYFMMAKTIEPRFSLWQEYGFRKLIEDSVNSAQYLLTKLGTTDHRETQVMRVLAQKIQISVADALLTKLNEYVSGKSGMTQPEVSFACYIFGETRNPTGKDVLLQLTYDDNYRIRSSAINALGKIKYDTTDIQFINKVSGRLSELAKEDSDKKLYNKDIAFALGNYKTPESFATLLNMVYNSYYGARFVAAENMKSFPQLPLITAVDSRFPEIPNGEIPLIAFMQSLTAIDDTNFKIFVGFIKMMPEYGTDAVKINLLEILRLRRGKSSEPGFLDWYISEINELQSYVKLKTK